MRRSSMSVAGLLLAAGLAAAGGLRGADEPLAAPASSRVDPYVARPRLIVMTDIANEPDDQMSLVRFLLYSNQFDVEGLVATTSTWMKDRVRPDVIHSVLDAYEKVQPRLSQHASGFPTAATLRTAVATGQPGYGMASVGSDKTSPGAERILASLSSAPSRVVKGPRPATSTCWSGSSPRPSTPTGTSSYSSSESWAIRSTSCSPTRSSRACDR